MSRVGNKPIIIPENVEYKLKDNKLFIKSIYGELLVKYLPFIKIEIVNNSFVLTRTIDTKSAKSYHGYIRVHIQNCIIGVTQNFNKILVLEGIGFKFLMDENVLIVNVGFTHSHKFIIPTSIKVSLISSTKLHISGPSKEEITLFSDVIQNARLPEPYKGKGILYENQKIIRKIGKKRR